MAGEPYVRALLRAHATLTSFLAALANGDDATVESFVYPPTASRLGTESGTVAARFRGLWGQSMDAIRRSRPTYTARVLDGLVAFGVVEVRPEDATKAVVEVTRPTEAVVVALIAEDGGRWQVWGTPDFDWWRTARLVELPLPAESGRPVG